MGIGMSFDTRYTVITPIRDEEAYLKLMVESIIRQTIRPIEFILVNDGSKDQTGKIIDEYCSEYPWIRAVHRTDRGFRKVGGGIIEAFYAGFHALAHDDWGFLSKMDGDLSFEPDYFERCFERFRRDPRLGIGGGYLYHVQDGVRKLEMNPSFHVRGGNKIYRRACWEAIGGLWVGPGSDTIDDVKANMLGWSTHSFPELLVHHHRVTGSAYGIWGAAVKDGRADYVSGYHPLFMLAKCCARLFRKPFIIGSVGLFWGYVKSLLKSTPRVDDRQVIDYLRQQQLARLLRRETIWK
jgi:glycosyltransferase involved in cell wall biosynthesis